MYTLDMPKRSSKKRVDINQLAKYIVDDAKGRYILTYTALKENYDIFIGHAEKIIKSFKIVK